MGNIYMKKLRTRLMDELAKHGKKEGDIATPDMEAIYKLSESIKAIDTICAMEDYGDEEEYSERGSSYRGHSRDSMGRYSGSPYSGTRGWPMSYDDAKFNMVHKLGDLMMCTENEHTKSVLRNAINQIENG